VVSTRQFSPHSFRNDRGRFNISSASDVAVDLLDALPHKEPLSARLLAVAAKQPVAIKWLASTGCGPREVRWGEAAGERQLRE
jgi:hypothetical protein